MAKNNNREQKQTAPQAPAEQTQPELNTQEVKKEEQVELTEAQVWDIIQFARSMSGIYGSSVLTPDLVSGRMKELAI